MRSRSSGFRLSLLLVPWAEHHLSSFKCGFLNIFSRQNLLPSLSRLLFLLWRNKYGAKKCLKNHIPFDFWDDSTLANQRAGKTIEKPLKDLPWNQQLRSCPYKAFLAYPASCTRWLWCLSACAINLMDSVKRSAHNDINIIVAGYVCHTVKAAYAMLK